MERWRHLQPDCGAADAVVVSPAQEAAHVALDGGRARAHELGAQLVQLRHLAGAQEHLRLAQLEALRRHRPCRASIADPSSSTMVCAMKLQQEGMVRKHAIDMACEAYQWM